MLKYLLPGPRQDCHRLGKETLVNQRELVQGAILEAHGSKYSQN